MGDARMFGLKPLQGDEKFISLLPKLGLGMEEIKPKIWPPLLPNGNYPLIYIKLIYDQSQYDNGKGIQGCTGYALSEAMTIWHWIKEQERKPQREEPRNLYNTPIFCPWWLYHEGQRDDPDPRTTPERDNGAYLWYVLQVLQFKGHTPIEYKKPVAPEEDLIPNRRFGIESFAICTTVDEVRTGLSIGPMAGGIAYYDDFMFPRAKEVLINGIWRTEYWIGEQDNWGGIPGFHAICIIGGCDDHEAIYILGTWGPGYQIVLLPYRRKGGGCSGGLERLLEEGAEFYSIKFRE